jgi:hypothetical protein
VAAEEAHIAAVKAARTSPHARGAVRHFQEYFQSRGWDPLIRRPQDPLEQSRLRQWLAHESRVHGLKGGSIRSKTLAVNKHHVDNFLKAPFTAGSTASAFLRDLENLDAPALGRLAVTLGAVELFALENSFHSGLTDPDFDKLNFTTAMSLAIMFMLRSIEYLCPTGSTALARGLHWRDVIFKKEVLGLWLTLTGPEVSYSTALSLSISSNKNALGRCTRTAHATTSPVCAVGLMRLLYSATLIRTGRPPVANNPVFVMSDRLFMTRPQLCNVIQELMASVGVPRHFIGTHSFRRGGACLFRKVGISDDEIRRFGRWESDAHKRYITLDEGLMLKWADQITQAVPRFELN